MHRIIFYRSYCICLLASGRREAVGSGNTLDRRVDSAGERRKESRLREAEDVVEELGGTVLPDCQTNSSVDQEDHHTLMKHIQVELCTKHVHFNPPCYCGASRFALFNQKHI